MQTVQIPLVRVEPQRQRPSLADVRVAFVHGNAEGAARATLLGMHRAGKGGRIQRAAGRLLAAHGDDAMRYVVHAGLGAQDSVMVAEMLMRAGVPREVSDVQQR